MKESTVLAECLEWLAQRRVFAWRNNTGAFAVDRRYIRYGHPGSSDILGVYRGRFLAIEVKSPTGKQSPDQKIFQRMVEKNGGIYLLVRSVDELADAMHPLMSQGG